MLAQQTCSVAAQPTGSIPIYQQIYEDSTTIHNNESLLMSAHAGPRGHRRSSRSKSINNDTNEPLDLQGPLDVHGSVRSGSGINFEGDIRVRGKTDAYGGINVNGNLNCEGAVKAYGNIVVNGDLATSDKLKGYGKLKLDGTLSGNELEIWGNVSIAGHLSCRRLVVYGSLTLIGANSTYRAETEEIAGPRLIRQQEADWDW